MAFQEAEVRLLLSNLGFTSYESKLLTCLYKTGPSKADELSKSAEVPLTRAYEALDSLIGSGFVSSTNSRPKIYLATNPQTAINRLIHEETIKQRTLLEKFTDDGNNLLELIQPKYLEMHTQITPEALLSQFHSLEEAEAYTIKIINEAENEIKIFTHVFNWYSKVKSALIKAIDRNCKVYIILQTDVEDQTSRHELIAKGFQVKVLPSMNLLSRGTIVDQQSMIYIIWASEEVTNSKRRRIYNPHASTNAGIIAVFNSYFDHLWNQS